jgi:hypothetical protein
MEKQHPIKKKKPKKWQIKNTLAPQLSLWEKENK